MSPCAVADGQLLPHLLGSDLDGDALDLSFSGAVSRPSITTGRALVGCASEWDEAEGSKSLVLLSRRPQKVELVPMLLLELDLY